MNGILTVSASDVERVSDRLFLTTGDTRRKVSAFWVLLALSAVIASAGVVADSVATVIGAMIVAPLMTPILGTAFAIVLGDRARLTGSIMLVIAGAAVVVLIAFAMGLLIQGPVTAETNAQVAGRVSPALIDLLAALATGLVGSFALLRSDVADSLPGVAIAISLVPPLAVVGLTLESGRADQALGALLLFATNVAAIVATGTILLQLSGVRRVATDRGLVSGRLTGASLVAVIGALLLVTVPLGIGSIQVAQDQHAIAVARPVVVAWAGQFGWTVANVDLRGDALRVVAVGLPPFPVEQSLKDDLKAAGLADLGVDLELVLGSA